MKADEDSVAQFLATQQGDLAANTDHDIIDILERARALDIVENLTELDALGFTIVPPEKVKAPELSQSMLDAVIDLHARRSGHRITDVNTESTGLSGPLTSYWSLLREDRAFELAVQHPVVAVLADYLCGRSHLLSDITCLIKNRDDRPTFEFHIDQFGTPPPLNTFPPMCNITWALTDHTRAAGTTAIAPGSHRFGRPPRYYEEEVLADQQYVSSVPLEAPAGSIFAWGGNTWHGAFPRSTDGVRVSVQNIFVRSYMRQIRDYRNPEECPVEALERNGPEFRQLLGIDHAYPCRAGLAAEPAARAWFKRSGMTPWS